MDLIPGEILIKGLVVSAAGVVLKHGDEAADVARLATSAGSVWNKNPIQRGIDIENTLAKTDYKDWFNVGRLDNGKFPLVDFQKGNNLVSLKTVDTSGKTWKGRIQEHIAALGSGRAFVDGKKANMILDLRVQPGGSSAASSLIQYGRQHNVTVMIKEFH